MWLFTRERPLRDLDRIGMKREEIEKAAKKYAEKKWVLGQRAVNKDGFKAGVEWTMKIYKMRELVKEIAKN